MGASALMSRITKTHLFALVSILGGKKNTLRGSRQPKPTQEFTGKENKHARVEGQARKAVCQTVLFTRPTWLELLMF